MSLKSEHIFYTQCAVTINQKHLLLKPAESVKCLLIDRDSLDIGFSLVSEPDNRNNLYLGQVSGILGIIRLVKRSYLLAISGSTCVASHDSVHKIDSVAMFPIQDVNPSPNDNNRDTLEWEWEQIYLKMISDLFKSCSFYYSATYDLTNSLQKNMDIRRALGSQQPYRHSDQRFQWNYNIMELFDSSDLHIAKFRLPIIMGFVTQKRIDSRHSWMLVSRRGTKRAGTRFNRRGVDDDGNVANFVETEQLLYTDNCQSSFVQVRGSIPIYWGQTPTYQMKPPIDIYPRDHDSAMEKHYHDLKSNYGEVSVACLIDQHGHEADISREFTMRMNNLKHHIHVPYHYFNFHKECSKMQWHRLSLLIEELKPEIDSYGLYWDSNEKKGRNIPGTRQSGVIRSNCIDSLDRTNVVQSMIAKYVLGIQLRMTSNESLSNFPLFTQVFQDAWADNADALSIQYAGTPALKTDFTRTGKRTYTGILRDGVNSMTRYVSNNYLDNYRQDSFDLLLGNFVGYPSPSYRPIDLTSYSSTFPVALVMMTLFALYVYFRNDSSFRLLEN